MPRARDSDLKLLQAEGGQSFECFYRRYLDLVTQYVVRRVDRPDLTLDVVAETFARALEHRRRFDERKGPAAAWLLTIARNVIRDAARRGRVAEQTRYRLRMQPIDLSDRDLEAIVNRAQQPLTDALVALPADQREAIRRRVLEEDTYQAIAADAGCSEQVVRQRVRRGLLRLREDVVREHS